MASNVQYARDVQILEIRHFNYAVTDARRPILGSPRIITGNSQRHSKNTNGSGSGALATSIIIYKHYYYIYPS